MRVFRERKPGRTFLHDVTRLFVFIYVFPIAIALISVDYAFWKKVIPALATGHYFGRLDWLHSSGDRLLEAVALVLMALPVVLPVLWFVSILRRSIREWRSRPIAN